MLTKTQVSELYVAIFNRASEGDGNTYWQTNQTNAEVTANTMLATGAAITFFGDSLDTDQAFIEHIYLNTFNKTVTDDADGIAFWVAQLTAGDSRGKVIADIVTAAQSPENAGAAQDQFNNRVLVSDDTADKLAVAPSDLTAVQFIAEGLGVVTDDAATVTVATALVDVLVDSLIPRTFTLSTDSSTVTEGTTTVYTVTADQAVTEDTVVTFTLSPGDASSADQGTNTTNLNDFAAGSFNTVLATIAAGATTATFDVATINDGLTELPETYSVTAEIAGVTDAITITTNLEDAGSSTITTFVLTTGLDNVTGGDADDLFFGVVDGTTPANTTLNSFDTIDGGAGTDTFNLTLTANNYDGSSSISSIEKFVVQTTSARTFDANGLTGVDTIFSDRSTNTLTINNLAENTAKVGYSVISTAAADLTGVYSDTALSGADDTVTIEFSGGVGSSASATGDNEVLITSTTSTNGAENLIVNVTGKDAFVGKIESEENSGDTQILEKFSFTGDKNLTIIDALDFTGTTAIVDASAATGGLTAVLTDAVAFTATGGAGNDSFDFTTTLTAADVVDMGEGTDTIKIEADTITLAALTLSNIEQIDAKSTAGGALTVATTGQTGLETVAIIQNDTTSIDATIDDLAAGVVIELHQSQNGEVMGIANLGLADASGTADELNIIYKGTSGNGTESIEDISISNIETLSINSTNLGTTASLTSDTNYVDDISADTTLTTLNLTGATNLQVDVGSEATNLATIDGSAATGDVTVALAATGDVSVTTGTGDDTITFAGTLTNADSVDGGTQGSLATSGDTVTATINGLTAVTGALTIANVENIHLDTATAASTIDATLITGADLIGVASAQNVTITGLAATTAVGLGYDATDDDYSGTVNISLADETGTADNVTITIVDQATNNGVSATVQVSSTVETTTINQSSDNDGTDDATLTITGIASANLVVQHTLTTGVTAVNLLAADTLTLGTLSTTTTSLDASTYAGIISATGSATTTAMTLKGGVNHDVTGGSSGDTITITTNDATAVAYNVDGGTTGSSTSTLNVTLGSGALTDTNVDDFKTINYTVDASKAAVVTTVSGKGINDADATTVTVLGGNSLSTFDMGSSIAIGAFAGGQATGLTSLDASAFAGNITLNFGDSVLDTDLTIKGGLGAESTEIVGAIYDTAATELIKASGITNLNVLADFGGTSGETYTFNLTDVSDVGTFGVQAGIATADDTTVNLTNVAAGMAIGLGSSGIEYAADTSKTEFFGTSTLAVTLASNSGTADALTLKIVDTDGQTDTSTVTAAGIEALTLEVANSAEVHTLNLAGVDATSGSLQTITITGGQSGAGLSIANVDTTNDVIDASAFLGDLTITDRSANATTITTNTGADSVKHENVSDVINLGTGTDTLTVSFQSIGKVMDVDMSVATDVDMITVGGVAGTVQSNFEHVDLAAFTGNGANITGSTAANTITGTAVQDSINGGLGADDITGGQGVDFITLTETVASVDIVNLGDSTDGNNYDQITGFTTTSDDVKALQTTFGWNSTDGATTVLLATGATLKAADVAGDSNIMTISANVATDTYVTFIANTSTYAQLETAAATAMGDTGALDAAAIVLVAIDDGTHTGLWQFTSSDAAADDATTASEIELIGILKGVADATALVVGDFLFS